MENPTVLRLTGAARGMARDREDTGTQELSFGISRLERFGDIGNVLAECRRIDPV